MTTDITLHQCGKVFGATRVLEPVDLSIHAGETLVFLGPSGCGKTTLLRLIAGLESPDAGGRILFGGRDVTRLPIEKRNVGMVFQSYALFPNMSVAENIGYGLKIRGVAKAQRQARVAEMLEMMRIPDLGNRAIAQLSGGQRQRVALARAVAAAPDVLLLDEPLTALDAKLRDTLRGEINTLLRGLGITTIYVTHDQQEAMALADRLVVMRKGHIAQIGTPREIWFQPADAFVADFIGASTGFSGHVEAGLLHVAGLQALCAQAPGRCKVMLRPQALRVAAEGVPVRIEAAQFLGERTRLSVTLPDGTAMALDAPPGLEALPGAMVPVSLDLDHLIILPESSAA
ncbi:ABC transporter ATP-binding protein [Acidocella facilis]|uniref:ABC transporter ATP-binding protein n=1 Tax=Acidocella facilis TaxID=525 RepID=UPI001F2DF3C8|nr:ABC transporter ATP-binding protein [Acidocella facilis]